MRLDADIGNTRLKWRLGGRGPAVAVSMDAWPESVGSAGDAVDSIYVGSVADSATNTAFVKACQERWGLTPQFAQVMQGMMGLQVSYKDPQQLGVDRWLAMLAARQLFPAQPLAVVSAGTALTVDLVETDGRHGGGYIVAGLGLAKNALMGRAARLKDHSFILSENPQAGQSTQDCLCAGYSTMYQEFLRRALQTSSADASRVVVFTGGDAVDLFPLTGFLASRHLIPDLVLAGLLRVFPDSE